jgi:serine protease
MNKKTLKRSLGVTTIAAAIAGIVAAYAAEGGSTAAAAVAATDATALNPFVTAGTPARQHGAMPVKSAAQPDFDRFIVKYRNGSAQARNASSMISSLNATAVRAGLPGPSRGIATLQHVRRTAIGADLVRMSRALDRPQAESFMAALRADPNVEYAQPDYIKQRLDVVPNDTHFGRLQWDFTHPTAGIHAPAAWDSTAGEGVIVAVLDTGYLDHADLNANIVPGYDFINDVEVANDGDGRDADAHDAGDWQSDADRSSFHGTHVAGTVAAVTNNNLGVAGVAYNAKVQPVRVLGRGGGYTSDIADAIVWASGGHVDGVPDNPTPAEVINMSLGGQGLCSQDPMTQAAIDSAVSRGVTVVVAAGNDTADASFFSPASCKHVITVGASGIDGGKAWFSNYGGAVAISAPGGNATSVSSPDNAWIWSLGNRGTHEPLPSPEGDAYVGMIGTSMASPHVAGIVALMQSAAVAAGNSPLTPDQVRTVLRRTARPFTVVPPSATPVGAGIADAAAAVAAAKVPVTEEPSQALVNRQVLTGQSGVAGGSRMYAIDVPAGTSALSLRAYGGTGDVALYAAFQDQPTIVFYDKVSRKPGNSETITFTSPLPGTYYLRVVGEKAFGNVSVVATY